MTGVHVVFGTGALGTATAEALRRRDLPIRLVNRSGSNPLGDDAEVIGGDAADEAFAVEAGAGAAAVYQLLNPPYHRWAEEFPGLQRNVMAAAQAADAKLVSLENVYLYGNTHGRPMTEESPVQPNTRKGQVRAAMAADLAEAHAAGRLRVATARASDYFGPRATTQSPLGDRVVPAALAGKRAQVLGRVDQPHSWTYAADAGEVMAMLGTNDQADGEVWHIPNDVPRTQAEMMDLIYAETGHEPKVTAAPKMMMRLVGLFNPAARELVEMYYEFEQPFIVDGSKFTDKFGFVPTGAQEAVRATVAWYRENT